jgi:hypothetical protein
MSWMNDLIGLTLYIYYIYIYVFLIQNMSCYIYIYIYIYIYEQKFSTNWFVGNFIQNISNNIYI